MTAPKLCFDRLLPEDLFRPLTPPSDLEAIIVIGKLWPNGTTLRVRFLEGTAPQRQLAMAQANWWTEHVNLRFAESEDADAEIRVAFDANDGAWSYVGTDCRGIPQSEPTMNLGFQDGGTSAHEFGHAIGMAHEHQNPAGGIQWNEPEVIRDLSGPPNQWTVEQIRHNVLEKYGQDQIRGARFDPDSIMLYAFPARWTLNGVATHANHALSDRDKAFMARMYPKPQAPTAPTLPELIPGAPPLPARIGVPGEEDLYRVIVTRPRRLVIETGGETDVMMRLFGPNSRTNVLAEDDDGGVGLNAKIVARLIPGEYLVQVRHYNRRNGVGDYTIVAR